uniref:L-tryptophan decarboxylase PsiD-like domain-containing protein n=1 Tax=Amphimedon queenslandica TaxID=400682 RepID=A0A1X7TV80_AMPQE
MEKAAQAIPYCVGKWLPSDQAILNKWLENLIEEVDGKESTDGVDEVDAADEGLEIVGLQPPVRALKVLIETDSEVNMFFHQMFRQIPAKDPTCKPQVRNYRMMLRLINRIMTKAPEFNGSDLVGFPINAILNWPMGTTGGFAAFLNGKVNAHFKNILNHWAIFLKSEESCYVLTTDENGWLGPNAMAHPQMQNFAIDFVCDPSQPHYGFKSWDDFFTREFRKGIRPVASPDDPQVIVNACESAPFNIQTNVRRRDRFWIKSQPYSINFMLANDPLAEQFVGGTVYQAFLNAFSYHRWHSPVDGTIVKAYVQDGSYYSEAQSEKGDPAGPNNSQGYITEVATRGIIFIEADNPKIGLMCFIAVGMAEVSTCEITVFDGQHVQKGQQIGMFHFGGSTHCLVFRKDVNLTFDLHGQTPGLEAHNIPVKAKIAMVQ